MRVTELNRPYRPYGAAEELFYSQDRVVLLSGPARCGKSRAALEKIHFLCEEVPGVRVLIARKVRADLAEAALQTFEDDVLPVGHALLAEDRERAARRRYDYPDGSEIVIGGFNKVRRMLSTEYDLIYIQQAEECTENDIETISTRLSHGRLGYQQLVMDVNPDAPTHHLKLRAEAGRCRYLEMWPRDNPRFWDHGAGTWTPEGAAYYGGLEEELTGSRRERLLLGRWVEAEGARFKGLDSGLFYPGGWLFDIEELWPGGVPAGYTKLISIDHGVADPYCALWHAVASPREVFTYREDYERGFDADEQVQRVIDLSPANERYYAVKLDPSMRHQDKRGRAKMASEKSAADYYVEALAYENERLGFEKFGPVVSGARVEREIGFTTLAVYLHRKNRQPNWYVERTRCRNLRKEIEGAVFWKTPQGVQTEKLDPKCADHALTSAIYGLHDFLQAPAEEKPEVTDPAELERLRAEERYRRSLERFRRTHRRRG